MRFVVFKGVQGFGDRLQCLLQVIHYARATNRLLVLDWRDDDWTHDPNITTDYFFSLQGVSTFGLNEFLAYWRNHKNSLKTFPNSWKDKLESPDYSNWIYDKTFWTDPENELVNLVAGFEKSDFDAEVVVYCGVGKRTFTYADANAIHLSRWVQDKIKQDFLNERLEPRLYGAIHLRGGSKSWAGGYVPLQDLRQRIDGLWPNQISYLESLYRAYLSIPNLSHYPKDFRSILISDSKDLCQAWVRRYGFGTNLPTHNEKIAESGLHKLAPKDLQEISPTFSKVELNYELLRDFTLMLNAKYIVGDGVSLFSDMAQKCALAGVRWVDF